jgi:acyl-CoA thioesterase FadM
VSNPTFSLRRRVGFGECDPARIVYAPRTFDYAVEAVEAWWQAVLGDSWSDLITQHHLEAKVVRIRCEYLRPLVAGQVLQVTVSGAEVGTDAVTCSAVGELAPGQPGFRARVVMSFVERGQLQSVPIPSEYHRRLESCRAGHDPSSGIASDEQRSAWAASGLRTADAGLPRARALAGPRAAPFVRQRRVVYGECGASGSVYPPRIVEHAVEAVGEWYETVLGISWLQQCHRRRGTPFVDIRCDYFGRIVAGQEITMAVTIPRLGTASIEYVVEGHAAGGVAGFLAHMTACHIDEEGGTPRATPFSAALRERILEFQHACAVAAPSY